MSDSSIEDAKKLRRVKRRSVSGLKSSDLVLLLLTCLGAPLAAHLCDLLFGAESNPLSSEKLLCAYFVLIAFDVVWNNFYTFYRKTKLWKIGWRFGGSDIVPTAVFFIAVTFVLAYYDTLIGTFTIMAIFVALFVLLWLKRASFQISSWGMISLAFMMAVIVPVALLGVVGYERFYWIKILAHIGVNALAVVFAFDAVAILVRKIKERLDRRKENQSDKR